jgi:redox-sensitive bicupin YhaK (pirin superfamily)
MEIITYILEGELEHKDSMGTGSVIRPGDLQRMTAGTGVAHSEYNPSDDEPVHLLQIWILPEREGLPPSYEQISFAREELRSRLRLIASPDGAGGSVTIHQDARVYAIGLELNETVTHELEPGRHSWIQVARGALKLNDNYLKQGDGAAVSNESVLTIVGTEPAEALLFDLA